MKAKTWTCIRACYWGKDKGQSRLWKVGTTIQSETRPNKHFIDQNAVEEEFQFDAKPVAEIGNDDMQLMTKKQINEKFVLGFDKRGLGATKKDTLIKMVIDRNNVKIVTKR